MAQLQQDINVLTVGVAICYSKTYALRSLLKLERESGAVHPPMLNS